MSKSSITDESPQPTEGLKRKRFDGRWSKQRLLPEEAERQGRIAQIAWKVMDRDQALVFLNSHSDELGGRPLDVAIKSADGFALVEQAIARAGKA